MLKCTSSELTLILSLLEILFPSLCLFLFINIYRSKSVIALGVFVGFLCLFWTKACVGEVLGIFLLYIFLYALILYLLTRNAFICVHLVFIGANLLLAVQISVPGL
jgi:hypothetical protein